MNENKQEEGSLQKLIESETRKAQQTFKTDKRLRSLPIEKKNEKLESLVAAKIKNIFVSWIDNDRIKQVDPEFLEIPTGYIENGYLHPIIPGDKDTRKMLERLIWLYEDYSFRVHLGTNS